MTKADKFQGCPPCSERQEAKPSRSLTIPKPLKAPTAPKAPMAPRPTIKALQNDGEGNTTPRIRVAIAKPQTNVWHEIGGEFDSGSSMLGVSNKLAVELGLEVAAQEEVESVMGLANANLSFVDIALISPAGTRMARNVECVILKAEVSVLVSVSLLNRLGYAVILIDCSTNSVNFW